MEKPVFEIEKVQFERGGNLPEPDIGMQDFITKQCEKFGKLQIMVGNLVYNNDNEKLDTGIKQILEYINSCREQLLTNLKEII